MLAKCPSGLCRRPDADPLRMVKEWPERTTVSMMA